MRQVLGSMTSSKFVYVIVGMMFDVPIIRLYRNMISIKIHVGVEPNANNAKIWI